MGLIIELTEIASHLFRKNNMEIAVHGNESKFELVKFKLEMMLNAIKNENSRFEESHELVLPGFEQNYHKTFFKAPLTVNHVVESMMGPSYKDEDYATGLILSEMLTHNFLLQSIREKGGAYGAGCKINESGLIDFYSFRDPSSLKTYDHFERAILQAYDGKFGEMEIE